MPIPHEVIGYEPGRSPSGRATRASTEPQGRLGHSAGIPNAARFPEARRAWRRLKFAWADYWAARSGCVLVRNPFAEMNGHVLFSVRNKISRAIADPGLYFERIRTADNMLETLDHWQARAAIEAMMQCAISSPSFAQAIDARQRQDAKRLDPKDESAVPATSGDAS